MPGTLILCATPIGNLGDAPPRLREAIADADVVYAEDTRRSYKLLHALGVDQTLRSYFAGNEAERSSELAGRLREGATIVLLTDAGTPSISDPGLSAVNAAIAAGADVTVIPGPSAVTAALAVSGLPTERFVFEGFLPRKGSERTSRLMELANEPRTVVLFAGKGKVARDLADLATALGAGREVAVARELTKLHEEVWRGTLGDAATRWSETVAPRGEFTLVIAGAVEPKPEPDDLVAAVAKLESAGISRSEAVREVARLHGVSRRELYEAVIKGPAGA
jgi:16S rRNA (cytidine1402-2'-O)-methyltransferase